MKKKTYAGYINLKPINGVIFPSYIQNQTFKNFINNELGGHFYMTTNENMYGENSIILKSLLCEKIISGIVFLSTFCLPEDPAERKKIYNLAKKNKKKFIFIFEKLNLNFRKKSDVERVEEFILFDQEFFTNKKTIVNKNEKIFLNPEWKFI